MCVGLWSRVKKIIKVLALDWLLDLSRGFSSNGNLGCALAKVLAFSRTNRLNPWHEVINSKVQTHHRSRQQLQEVSVPGLHTRFSLGSQKWCRYIPGNPNLYLASCSRGHCFLCCGMQFHPWSPSLHVKCPHLLVHSGMYFSVPSQAVTSSDVTPEDH